MKYDLRISVPAARPLNLELTDTINVTEDKWTAQYRLQSIIEKIDDPMMMRYYEFVQI